MVNNYLLYKTLLYNIKSNNSFIPCTIIKNDVQCENNIIKQDIVSKNIMTIEHVTFYIFVQSYDIFTDTANKVYYDVLKKLPIDLLPVYQRDMDFSKFIQDYKDFNNLEILSYGTKYLSNQIYAATNINNINRHGIMSIISLFNYRYVNNKSSNDIYLTQEWLDNTISTMYKNQTCGIIVGIKDNKVVIFLPFHNQLIKCNDVEKYLILFETLCKSYTVNNCVLIINLFNFTLIIPDNNISFSHNQSLKNIQNILKKIVLYKSVKNNPIKIAIIACYRDNIIHSRYKELQMYKYIMSKMLINNNINFKIIIVEQNHKDKFNIGKLKNIGFHYINLKETFDNYIFTDIDMIPDYKLLKYFTKITDGINTLAIRGTRYSNLDKSNNKKEFFGGCIACTKNVYEQVNGYSNLYSRGWGGEDDNLVIRVKHEKITNYVPKIGNIIDIEEIDGNLISLSTKLSQEKGRRVQLHHSTRS